MFRLVAVAALALVAACEPVPTTPERAAAICAERARAVQGPTGAVTIGASSDDGPFLGTAIGVSSDFLTGRDPAEVYERCYVERTGTLPIRPLALTR